MWCNPGPSVPLQEASPVSNPSPDVVKAFAPTGTLRVSINLGNTVLAQRAPDGSPAGITPELARELSKRLGVPLAIETFDAAGKVFEAIKAGRIDVAFLAVEPVRAAEIDFTAPYVLIEGTYLVAKNSALKEIEDVDKPGVKIAVATGSAYDLYLSRTIKNATLVREPSGPQALAMFKRDKLDAAGGVRQPLVEFAAANPEYRVMPGRFMAIQQAMGMPKGRAAAAVDYLKAFVEEMKASGFVADALKRSNQPDAQVAPKAQ
ncbi:MAG: ABC transporter substrate-binding protein [Alphaproteobacteria bacterium]|nr:ABC transporter substrate-binding protein [Alphaproteobacteria bacterium]